MASQPTSQRKAGVDAVKADPKHYKVELENEKVRVLRVSYGPHEKSAMHSHPASVAIFLTDDHRSRHTLPDGKSEELSGKAGEVKYMEAWEHNPENLSDKPFEVIVIELKS
jgi:quercetin dioxygenase-like cupin family protein